MNGRMSGIETLTKSRQGKCWTEHWTRDLALSWMVPLTENRTDIWSCILLEKVTVQTPTFLIRPQNMSENDNLDFSLK